MTMRRRLALFASLCLLLALAVPPARAAGEQTGSIRVAAEMTIHRVGEHIYYDIIASPKPGADQPDTGQPLGVTHWLAVSAGALCAIAALRRRK